MLVLDQISLAMLLFLFEFGQAVLGGPISEEQGATFFSPNMVVCNDMDAAIRTAQALASITVPNDGADAYELYRDERKNCSFSAIAMVGSGDPMWGWGTTDEKTIVLVVPGMAATADTIDGPDPLFLVIASRNIMDVMMACDSFFAQHKTTKDCSKEL